MTGAPRPWKDRRLVICHVKKTEAQFMHLWMELCDGCHVPRVDEWEKGDCLLDEEDTRGLRISQTTTYTFVSQAWRVNRKAERMFLRIDLKEGENSLE